MAYVTEDFQRLARVIARLPIGTHFDTPGGGGRVELQAQTQVQVREIRATLPGVIWTKEWEKDLKWWNYRGEFEGVRLLVYAVKENPPTCKAIVEKRVVEVSTPTAWATEKVEKEVIVGWDCGPSTVGAEE